MLYADNNGSMPMHPDVKEYLLKRLEGPFANPNAIHSLGQQVNRAMEKCRKICAEIVGTKRKNIIFNSGSSEGIAHIFHSVLGHKPSERNIIITSGIEHSAVVNNCKNYQDLGYTVKTINTLKTGEIDLDHLKSLMSDKVAMVTVMATNNETGVIQPYKEIGSLAHEFGAIYFSDTTQIIGKDDFNFDESQMDFAVMSSHKIGSLIGTGFILARDIKMLSDFIPGGGQERGFRGGTQNYIGVECLTVAMQAFEKEKHLLHDVRKYRDEFETNIKKQHPSIVVIGDKARRIAGTTLISYPGIHGQAVQIELESKDIFVTTSSACSDNEPETSKVLKAMNISDDIGRGVVRISFCCGASSDCYQYLYDSLNGIYEKLSQVKTR
jgi:cysteine desulfurase